MLRPYFRAYEIYVFITLYCQRTCIELSHDLEKQKIRVSDIWYLIFRLCFGIKNEVTIKPKNYITDECFKLNKGAVIWW